MGRHATLDSWPEADIANLTELEYALMDDPPTTAVPYAHAYVGDDHFRTAERDRRRKTMERYFYVPFVRDFRNRAGDARMEEGIEDRFGELLGIYRIELGDRPYTLFYARWFPNKRLVDNVANVELLELHREWDTAEPFVEARYVKGQVCLREVPIDYDEDERDRPLAVVLDRNRLEHRG